MPFLRVEPALLEAVVIGNHIAHICIAEEFVAPVHFRAQRSECGHDFLRVGDDGVVFLGKFCHVLVGDITIEGELHHLGVDEHELQFIGVFGVEQRCDYAVQAYRFALAGGTGNQKVWHFGKILDEHVVGNRGAKCYRQLHFCLLGAESRRFQHFAHGNNLRIEVGHLYAYGAAPGHGGDYADACCRKAHGDVVFQAFDFGDSGALGRHDFIESYRGADGGFDAYDFDVVALEGVYNHLLVGSLFTGIDFDASGAVEQQFGGRELVGRMSGPRVVQCLKAHVVAVVDFLGGILFESILGRGGAYNKLRLAGSSLYFGRSCFFGSCCRRDVLDYSLGLFFRLYSNRNRGFGCRWLAVERFRWFIDAESFILPELVYVGLRSFDSRFYGRSVFRLVVAFGSGCLQIFYCGHGAFHSLGCWLLLDFGPGWQDTADCCHKSFYGMQEHGHKQAGKNHTHGECAQCACIVNQQSVYVLAMFTT